MIEGTPKHKVFISFHNEDEVYKKMFVEFMEGNIVDKAVGEEDIDDNPLRTETIRQRIRDNFISDATVTLVLIGPCTWQRKHVDWEIGSSLRETRRNSRCGLLGIRLPNHPDYGTNVYSRYRIPPRLADNCNADDPFGIWTDPFAILYDWPQREKVQQIKKWIHRAYERRKGHPPNNSRAQFARNRSGDCRAGWRD